jgi:hypothetical protein
LTRVHGWNAPRPAVHAVAEKSFEETPVPGVGCPGIPCLYQHGAHTYLDFDFTVRLKSREIQVNDTVRIGPSADFSCPDHFTPLVLERPQRVRVTALCGQNRALLFRF